MASDAFGIGILVAAATLALAPLMGLMGAYRVRRGLEAGAFSKHWAESRARASRYVWRRRRPWTKTGVVMLGLGGLAALALPGWIAFLGTTLMMLGAFLLFWMIRAQLVCQALDTAHEADPEATGRVLLAGPFPFATGPGASPRQRIGAAAAGLAFLAAIGLAIWLVDTSVPWWVFCVPVALLVWSALR